MRTTVFIAFLVVLVGLSSHDSAWAESQAQTIVTGHFNGVPETIRLETATAMPNEAEAYLQMMLDALRPPLPSQKRWLIIIIRKRPNNIDQPQPLVVPEVSRPNPLLETPTLRQTAAAPTAFTLPLFPRDETSIPNWDEHNPGNPHVTTINWEVFRW